ncbi:MAG: hypothetical protein ACRD3W_20160, partial [Terriglobales bacterium]
MSGTHVGRDALVRPGERSSPGFSVFGPAITSRALPGRAGERSSPGFSVSSRKNVIRIDHMRNNQPGFARPGGR